VLGFAGWNALTDASSGTAALLAGATLQEVGHVVAAGDALGEDAADTALLVKLSRVVLLAPTLVVLGLVTRRARTDEAGTRPALLPGFVVGFLATSALVSVGAIPPTWATILADAGVIATAAAMAAIGLGVDLRVLRTRGRAAVTLGTLGFVALLAAMAAYYAVVPA